MGDQPSSLKYNTPVTTPPPAVPLTTRRLMLLWLWWIVATAVGFAIGWSISLAWFPWEIVPRSNIYQFGGSSLLALTPGIFVGLAQYAILRLFISKQK